MNQVDGQATGLDPAGVFSPADSIQASPDVQRPQYMLNVVPHRDFANAKLCRNPPCRLPESQQAQNLAFPLG
jgi:hypothetical protein